MLKLKFDEYNDSKARNRLTLEQRVQAIKAWEECENYSKVGMLFKCSSKQIRNIVQNRKEIMKAYLACPSSNKNKEKYHQKRRAKKIALLGEVMHEWFLRARRNPSICLISYKLIQTVAIETKKILSVDNFFPNNAWLLNFRQKYNISEMDMKVQSNSEGPIDLNIGKIVADVVIAEKKKELRADKQKKLLNSLEAAGYECQSSRINVRSQSSDDEPPTKFPKLEPIDVIEIDSDDDEGGDEEEDDCNNDDDQTEDSTLVIKTIDQALKHLKPLEDFALMNEDYRVIGLISQLEGILKSSK